MLDHEKVFRKKLYRFEFETFDQVCGVNLQILQILLLYQNSPISLIILGKWHAAIISCIQFISSLVNTKHTHVENFKLVLCRIISVRINFNPMIVQFDKLFLSLVGWF
jgi:hypothetical protein